MRSGSALADECARQLTDCVARLAELPEPIAHPISHVFMLLAQFTSRIHEDTFGTLGFTGPLQESRVAYATFKRSISSSAPAFAPCMKLRKRTNEDACVDLNEDVKIYLEDVRDRINA